MRGKVSSNFLIAGIIMLAGWLSPERVRAEFQPQTAPSLNIPRISEEIRIDGVLDETAWGFAVEASGYCTHSPRPGEEPDAYSKALVAYDEHNLYVAFINYDDPKAVRASLRERDNIWRDDYCGIMLDTYGDQSFGYQLFVNPLGIQGDSKALLGGDEDTRFDVVYFSEGIVTDSGYQVEMAIPFASLRFPDRPEQQWRINFWRDRQREHRYRYTWSEIDEDNPCFMCQWGYLTGLEGIKPSSNLEIIPNIIASQFGQRINENNPDSPFDNQKIDAEASVNIRYGLTSTSSLEVAVNPDFSQVESDADQIEVNTPFGLFFPEKRPFFQEGSEQFATWINVVYTRSVNDPHVAGKFTGQFGKFSLAVLSAYDDISTFLLPFPEFSVSGILDESIVNIARARYLIGNNSYVGAIFSDRRWQSFSHDGLDVSDGSGTNYGIDAAWQFARNYRFEFQAVGSHTEEPNAPGYLGRRDSLLFDNDRHTIGFDGESFSGHGMLVSFERSARNWNVNIDYGDYTPTFRTDNGYTVRNDSRTLDIWTGYTFWPKGDFLNRWEISLSVGRIWDHHEKIDLNPFRLRGGSRDEWIRPSFWFELAGQTNVNFGYLNSREIFAGKLFEGISRGWFNIDSRFSETLSGGFEFGYGKTIYRSRSTPLLGVATDVTVYLNIKPNQRLFIQPSFGFAQMDRRDRYVEVNDVNRTVYAGFITRTRVTYQFSREWYLRMIVQYDEFDDRLNVEPLLTWQLNPFSVFYIGMNSSYQHYQPEHYDLVKEATWAEANRQVFAKLQYLFRM